MLRLLVCRTPEPIASSRKTHERADIFRGEKNKEASRNQCCIKSKFQQRTTTCGVFCFLLPSRRPCLIAVDLSAGPTTVSEINGNSHRHKSGTHLRMHSLIVANAVCTHGRGDGAQISEESMVRASQYSDIIQSFMQVICPRTALRSVHTMNNNYSNSYKYNVLKLF